MKRKILLFLMAQAIGIPLYAQTVHVGPLSGTQGANGSYFGYGAGQFVPASGLGNSFFGAYSGRITQSSNNTAFGTRTLYSNTSGGANAASGYQSLYANVNGSHNTANGYLSLHLNTSGSYNTAIGSYSLFSNTQGIDNTATGYFSLYLNKTGISNTASGTKALYSNESGFSNTATGSHSLQSNSSGYWNTATGTSALNSNITGNQNTATGISAAFSNSRGTQNTANGASALHSNVIGNRNSAFGAHAGYNILDLENTTSLGYYAQATASNSVVVGNSSVTSIGGAVLWSTVSDGRFKRNIKEDVSGLDFVNQLRPVSYEVDKQAINRFLKIPDSVTQQLEAKKIQLRETGFIAQEVEAIVKKTGYVFGGIVAPQNEHDHYSIRYAAFVVPLVKAVQELTTKMNEQEKKYDEQQLEISALKEKLGVYEQSASDPLNTNLKVALFQNNPNPFTSDTEIKMALPETTQQASLILYNMEGRQLKNIIVTGRGNAAVKISGNDFSAGIYLYALIVDGKVVDTKRLILTK